MRWVIGCITTLAIVCGATADDKQLPATAALVVVSGKVSGTIYVSTTVGGETKKREVQLVELDDKTTLAVAVPASAAEPPKKGDKDTGVDPDLKRLLEEAAGTQGKMIVAAGRLSLTESAVVVAAVGGKGSKSVPFVTADKVTDLTAANAKDFPPHGSAQVDGVLTRVKVQVGRDSTDWAIRNEDTKDIPLLLAEGSAVPDAGSRVRATGPVKIVDGQFVVVAKTVDVVK